MSLLYEYRVFLFTGFVQTLLMSLAVAVGGTLCAIAMVSGMLSKVTLLSKLSYGLVEFLRDIPLMVTVLLVYFVLPMAGIGLDPFWSTCVAISVWGGANGAQILRAGLLSVGKGQRETAAAFGFGRVGGMFLIILPQAMPVIIPPYVGLLTGLVQATSLGAVVGAQELFRSGQVMIEQATIMQGGSPAYLVYGSILVVYFILCTLISVLGGQVEKYFLRPFSGKSAEQRVQDKVHDIESQIQTSA